MLSAVALWFFAAQVPGAPDLAGIERKAESEVKAQGTAENWQKLGLARFMQNRFETAIPAFQEALHRNYSLWPSHLFLGISLYRTNRFDEAGRALETARRMAPLRAQGSEDIDYWLGATYIALKQPWRGLRQLEELLTRYPRHEEALAMLARTYADLSGSLWNDVAERFFETPAGLEVHGHALEAEGNYTDALAAYKQARALAAKRPGPAREIGRMLLQQGKTAEALAVLQPERSADTSYLTALGLLQSGKTSEALPLLEEAEKWNRTEVDVPIALAQVLLSLQRPGEAVAPARKALELDPTSIAARELLHAALAQAETALRP